MPLRAYIFFGAFIAMLVLIFLAGRYSVKDDSRYNDGFLDCNIAWAEALPFIKPKQ